MVNRYEKIIKCFFKRCIFVVQKRYDGCFKSRTVQVLELEHINAGQNRIVYLKDGTVRAFRLKHISVRTDVHGGVGNDFFTERVNRRICNLCKKLLEVIEKGRVLVAHYGKRRINTHTSRRFNACFCHRQNHFVYVFVVPAERTVHNVALFLRIYRNFLVRN